jgi:hypothetical protein
LQVRRLQVSIKAMIIFLNCSFGCRGRREYRGSQRQGDVLKMVRISCFSRAQINNLLQAYGLNRRSSS